MSTRSPEDSELEEYLRGDSELSRAYHAGASEGPREETDRAILAAAREAARPQQAPAPFAGRWQVPAALAAVLVLAVGLTLRVSQEPEVPAGLGEGSLSTEGKKAVPRREPGREQLQAPAKARAPAAPEAGSSAARVDTLEKRPVPAEEAVGELEQPHKPGLAERPSPAAGLLSGERARVQEARKTPDPDAWLDRIEALQHDGAPTAGAELDRFAERHFRDHADPEGPRPAAGMTESVWRRFIELLKAEGREEQAARHQSALAREFPDTGSPQ